jgi:NurA-like 5'-3' nuclease
MESAGIKLLRLPLFDGKHEKFQVWWTQLEAYAGVFGFLAALKPGGEHTMPATDATVINKTTTSGKAEAAAKKQNAIAVANLAMSFTMDGTMALIYKSKTANWPNGLAWKIAEALKKKYQPQDTMTRVEVRHQLDKIIMKKDADPATLFEQLNSIENRYNTATRKIEEEDLIAVVIDAAPKQYQLVLTNEQLRSKNFLTMEDLNKAMNTLWRTHAVNTGVKQEEEELVLNAFEGFCCGCKKKGHKAHECPQKSARMNPPPGSGGTRG